MALMEFKDVSFTYAQGTPFEKVALSSVSLTLEKGSFVGIAGETGSGKSTLIKLLGGLLDPTSGTVLVDGEDVSKLSSRTLCGKVGLVFQYPEHQLFEETVLKDVSFGPKNLGLPKPTEKAKEALTLVGLDKSYWKRSPFSLSGGEKRRVALAGVLAMEPEVLVLDEPAAGLDPAQKEETFRLLQELIGKGKTILFVSHNMDDIARYGNRVILMEKGNLKADGTLLEVFSVTKEKPQTMTLAASLREHGFSISESALQEEDLVEEILRNFKS